ncbi:arginine repressor [Mesobacillus zeae]|uniref:Arginine repressor n=1 Tax=Mesobacillus zeae TaxID=1917180 RepID=A0A398BIA1_9BACI|nr:arginine repressor [Mesobacillus zeae]RID88771.1 arginine repressor [Mesobacillus zeae]
MKKEMRLKLIKELISENEIKTQEELASMLYKRGLDVTQATISRDLRSLRLIKIPGKNGGFKYSFKMDQDYYTMDKFHRKVKDSMVSIEAVHYFVIIKTLPGHAHAFGVILDAIEIEGKAGTICGNDTCLVICRSPEAATAFMKLVNPAS